MDKTNTEKLNRQLKESVGFKIDVFNSIYKEHVENSESPEEALRIIVEFDDEIGSKDNDSAKFNKEEIRKTQNILWPLLRELIRAVIREDLEVDEFYKKLYKVVFCSDLFPKDELTHAVLLKMISEDAGELPYFKLSNALDLSQEELSETVDSIVPWLKRAMTVLNRQFEKRTTETSQLWNIASELEPKEQIVFWSVIIGAIKRHADKEDD